MSGSRRVHLTFFLAFIFACNVVSSQLLSFYENKITINPDDNVKCNSELECVEGSCNAGRICIRVNGEFVQFATLTCDENLDTPYCNNGICSKIPRAGCGPTPSNQFVCPETNGIYPDPANCTLYHRCANRVVTTNVCPRNNVYDHQKGGCTYRRFASDCVTVSCSRNPDGQPFVYPRDDRIYGRCLLGRPYIFGRCKNYQRYDLAGKKCVRYCRAVGTQPRDPDDPERCRGYIFCAEVSPRRYEPTEMLCACNEGYDERVNGCVENAECLKNVSDSCIGNDTTGLENEFGNDDNDDLNEIQNAEVPFIINNSGSNNRANNISNGDDNVNGNLVNGNNNGNNSNSGNVNRDSSTSSQIINNSGSNNNDNNIANGNDNVDGNLVNGNNNGDNQESGNVQRRSVSPIDNYIINNSGSNNNDNSISNGNDDLNGNIVNGDNNGDNINSGNVKDRNTNIPSSPPIIDDSDESGDGSNEVSNEINESVSDGNDKDSNNDDSDDDNLEPVVEDPKDTQRENFLRIIIDWAINIVIGQPPAR